MELKKERVVMNIRRSIPAALLVLVGVAALSACGEPTAEELLERSQKVPELHQFGALFLPLYQEVARDSTLDGVRANIVELIRIKQAVMRVDVPQNLLLEKHEWDSNMRLFSRAVDNLNVVLGWRGMEAEVRRREVFEGVQHVYDWWQMVVEML